MNIRTLFFTAALSALSISSLGLSGCSGNSAHSTHSNSPYSKTSNIVDRAIQKALAEAKSDQESLTILGQMHTRDPKNQAVAIHYAQALRNDEQINPSRRVLEKFTKGENKSAEALTELSITNIALGDFKTAEMNALDALELSPNDGRAYLSMGTALDAQGRHEDAETAFRSGIKNWKGDPAPILNNLALNLASQGRLKQSLEILRKAKKISPHRMEIERNLRIISTLQETAGPMPPVPKVKPEHSTAEENSSEEKEEEKIVNKDNSDKKKTSKAPLPPKKAGITSSNNLNTKAKIDNTSKIKDDIKDDVEKETTKKDATKKAVIKYRPLNE
ncbi:MAG: hypothetical protein CMH31_04790 [Micavibrio sp.]|nr:hypothetical protein [Micavibrio sp.]